MWPVRVIIIVVIVAAIRIIIVIRIVRVIWIIVVIRIIRIGAVTTVDDTAGACDKEAHDKN